jgi:hypothetical protein
LSARSGRAHELLVQITFIDVDFAGDSHASSLIGALPADKAHRIDSTGYGEVPRRARSGDGRSARTARWRTGQSPDFARMNHST